MTVNSVSCNGATFVQTRFLGATIVDFTSSIGWNTDPGSLTVKLVEDPCNTQKVNYDLYGRVIVTSNSDLFVPPPVGSPLYFQYGTFIFTGILKQWKQTNSVSSGRTYTVVVDDASAILDSTQLILGGYNGPTFGIPNLLNVYGFMEAFEQSLGGACAIDPSLSNIMGYISNIGFGGAQHNEDGMPWNLIVRALNNMVNLPLGNLFSADFGGPRIQFKGFSYTVDLLNLGVGPEYYRINQENTTLANVIADVCEDFGCDYFTQLITVAPNNLILKVNTVSRFGQPAPAQAIDQTFTAPDHRLSFGTISRAIGDGTSQSPLLGQFVEDNERGVELRNEVANSMIVGEQRHDIWQIGGSATDANTSGIWPWWGLNRLNNVIFGQGLDDQHCFTVDSSGWGVGISNYPICVAELRAALGGEDMWKSYVVLCERSKAQAIGLDDSIVGTGLASNIFANTQIKNNKGLGQDVNNTAKEAAKNAAKITALCGSQNETLQDIWNRIFTHVSEYANNNYGKQYMVKMPWVCKYTDVSTGSIEVNWETVSSAWPEVTILGLGSNDVGFEIFKEEDGRVGVMVAFVNHTLYDISELPSGSYYINGNTLWVKGSFAQEEIVWGNFSARVNPWAVIELEGPVWLKNCRVNEVASHMSGAGFIASCALGATAAEQRAIGEALSKPGSNSENYEVGKAAVMPVGAAIPLKSKNLTYGPWAATIAGAVTLGPQGKSEFEKDTTYAPWNFGSATNMAIAALLKVNSKITYTQVIESGSLNAAGPPLFSLGNVLLAGGPNLKSVDVSVGTGGVKTGYRFQTFTHKFGLFSKERIDGIRKMGMAQNQNRRRFNLNFLKKRSKLFRNIQAANIRRFLHRGIRVKGNSPHHLLVSIQEREYENNDYIRTQVSTSETRQELGHLYNHYEDAAAVSMQGVFRPFSTKGGGSGDIAKFDEPSTEKWYPVAQVGPVIGEEHIAITVNTLNPFQNNASQYGFGNTSAGHDIEYVVRDSVYPTTLSVRNPNDNYGQNYRAVGIRGPIVMVGWGFDTNNKPVPNDGDGTLHFKENWLRRPDTWKAGPIDLRWDEDRGVWVSPTAFKLCRAIACEVIQCGGTGKMKLIDEEAQKRADGSPAESVCDDKFVINVITVTNDTLKWLRKGWQAWVYYDSELKKWRAFSMEDHLFLCRATEDIDVDCDAANTPPEEGPPEEPPEPTVDDTTDKTPGNAVVVSVGGCTPAGFVPTDLVIVADNVLGQPILEGDLFISYPKASLPTVRVDNVEEHWILQGQFKTGTFVTSVECDDTDLVVCDRKIVVEGVFCDENCPDEEGTGTGSGPGGCAEHGEVPDNNDEANCCPGLGYNGFKCKDFSLE